MGIARFEKVSFEQFSKDVIVSLGKSGLRRMDIERAYNNIKLPVRATVGSAGYDFFYPYSTITISKGQSILIPTGIKCYIDDGWWLGLFPKSSSGNNYRAQLEDTVSVIDGDYYNCKDNEGHIFAKISNNDRNGRDMILQTGKAYCQGIFLQYGLIDDDNVIEIRTGGLGSTNK